MAKLDIQISDGVSTLISKGIDLFILLYKDHPPKLRILGWIRWYRAWEPFWKLLGLSIKDSDKLFAEMENELAQMDGPVVNVGPK